MHYIQTINCSNSLIMQKLNFAILDKNIILYDFGSSGIKFNKKYEARFGERPNSQYTYPGYLVIEMWARAVEKAGTFETDAVVAAMETFREEPFLIGTRTFTNILHHQDRAPYLIVETTNGKPAVAADYTISEAVPLDVLFGKRYSYIAR